jgi:mediator of RNA polymerase II transcription subunit 12, fungi type
MVQLQLVLKQMGRDFSGSSVSGLGGANFDKLCLSLFKHAGTREEAFYVGQMMKGVDPSVIGKVHFKYLNNCGFTQ